MVKLQAWPETRQRMMDEINTVAPIYQAAVEKRAAFLTWVAAQGIRWPGRKSRATGQTYRPLDDETLKGMEDLGVEKEKDVAWRKELLRKFNYKL